MIENMAGRGVEVINRKGCSRLFMEFSSSFRGMPSLSLEPMSPALSTSTVSESPIMIVKSKGPFSGLVICVTGLSKETRNQVKEATERLGGQYSPHLHPQCTHLVVQSFHGRKFEHALKHGPTTGLFLVTIGWFVDSVKKNVRLNESLYSVNKVGESKRLEHSSGAENSCIPIGLLNHSARYDINEGPFLQFGESESKRQSVTSSFTGQSFYIDLDIPSELRSKVAKALYAEGVGLLDRWFIGCDATYVVCEGPSTRKYLGHSSNIVSPLWVLKSVKEKCVQRLVNLSADLARYMASREEVVKHVTNSERTPNRETEVHHGERQVKANLAKEGVRKRRNYRMQSCETPMRPITPSTLLDSICWTISEQTSTASVYTEDNTTHEDQTSSMYFDAKHDVKEFATLSRSLTESEKSEIIFKGHFLTILFPIDRFSEMGPCSRTFFSSTGFTCLQVMDHIYAFYQESMSSEEIEIAIHTDSRHADRLRSVYASKESTVEFKRIDFIGSRKSFEMLKRVSGDNNSNVCELLVRA